ncbi:MAG: hypothetical protein ACRDDY_07870 [Clostridium sp.]|uniref:hypothetical protein n=1 Tax=Clostridium sp. TaxID=1506 RepID=UPI003EE472EF
MNNCLLCKNCTNEAEGIDGYPVEPWYHCDIRESLGYDDPRFPYKIPNVNILKKICA